MYYLNHKLQIEKEENKIVLRNCITKQTFAVLNNKEIDFDKFKEIMYYGMSNDVNHLTEHKEMLKLIESFPASFIFCSDPRIQSLYVLIRQYTEFFLTTFISVERLEAYLNYADDVIREEKLCEVYLSLDPSLAYIPELLSNIPFLNITNEKEDDSVKNYDIVITKNRQYEQDQLWALKSDHILFLNVNQSSIEIGPLVFADKFRMPDLEFESGQAATPVFRHEESLLYFFLEKILYIYFFRLYDKINQIEFFPSRSRLCIDRMNLQGHGKLITMYPKYIE